MLRLIALVLLVQISRSWANLEDPYKEEDRSLFLDVKTLGDLARKLNDQAEIKRRSTLSKNFVRFGRRDESIYSDPEEDQEEFDDLGYARPTRSGTMNNNDRFVRFGRGKSNFLRFGRDKSSNFVRFGRTPDPEEVYRRKRDVQQPQRRSQATNSFVRFGRNDNFLRFGRTPNEKPWNQHAERLQISEESNEELPRNSVFDELKHLEPQQILCLLTNVAEAKCLRRS